ncbi:hypothetical protein LCGC14_1222150 [marine sediment metagenome]|uniref:IPT/TIG domain-containing protein n=1 Tax=marine sediment metagenome TaxID=412755 RepID=A0A0F9PFE3_9ZZZZ|nr:hypothetical protein [bacterium]
MKRNSRPNNIIRRRIQQGHHGNPGEHYIDAMKLTSITKNIFIQAFLSPYILKLIPNVAKEGDMITIEGDRFTNQDVVIIGNVTCPATYIDDKTLKFQVPKVEGGFQEVKVKQGDGTLSINKATLVVQPTISHVEQDGKHSDDGQPARFRLGSIATIKGTGLAPGLRVRVIDEDVSDSDIEFIDPHTVKFKVLRPVSTPPNAEFRMPMVNPFL